jgi:hypothetical protein
LAGGSACPTLMGRGADLDRGFEDGVGLGLTGRVAPRGWHRSIEFQFGALKQLTIARIPR